MLPILDLLLVVLSLPVLLVGIAVLLWAHRRKLPQQGRSAN